MANLHHPTEVPFDEVRVAIAYARGDGSVGRKQALDAAWWALGYPIEFVPDDAPHQSHGTNAIETAHCETMSDSELADRMESHLSRHGAAGGPGLEVFKAILPILLTLFQRWAFGG